jgi:hypothetical protein
VTLDQQDQQDLLEPQGLKEKSVLQETLDRQVQRVFKVRLVLQELYLQFQDLQVIQAQLELRAYRVRLALKVFRVYKVFREKLAQQELMVSLVPMVQLELLALQEILDLLARQGKLGILVLRALRVNKVFRGQLDLLEQLVLLEQMVSLVEPHLSTNLMTQ